MVLSIFLDQSLWVELKIKIRDDPADPVTCTGESEEAGDPLPCS